MTSTKTYQHILAIDGSTPVCTVALRVGNLGFERKKIGMGIHSSAIFSQINEVLAEAGIRFQDIDAVVIGIGPGSYTGLRVVASSIKGLLFRNSIPLFGVNSLAGFASCVSEKYSGAIHSIIDARRNHFYCQRFRLNKDGELSSEMNPEVIEIPELYKNLQPGDTIIGTGIERLDPTLLAHLHIISKDQISASGLIQIFLSATGTQSEWVDLLDVAYFEPKYAIEDFK